MPPTSDTCTRDQSLMDKDRRKFTAALIRALEESELRRLARSPQQLADAAWQKLQYDFPLVETPELQALLEAFSASFVGKTGWPCYLLTHKALDNISHGARGAGSYEPQLTEQEQAVQRMLAESLTNKVLARAGSSSSTSASAQPQPPQHHQQQQPASQQQLYQKLAAVLLLQYAAKVASLPEQDAWQLLQAYCPEHVQDEHAPHQVQQQQQEEEGATFPAGTCDEEAAIAAALVGASRATATAAHGTNSSCSVYEDAEAAHQDADSEEYEPLEAAQPHQQHSSSSSRHCTSSSHPGQQHSSGPHQQQQDDQQPFSWPVLHRKLLSLSEHVHYSLFNHEALWRQQDAAQHLLALLRTLGVHAHAQELQPLLHAYVGLLVDRLATAPQDLPLLHQLWEALGLTLASGLKQAGACAARQQQQQGLCPEAVLGLSVAAAVWQQLPGVSARKQLWQLMHRDLLPLLESCAEQLAYSSSSKGAGGTAAGGACTQGVAFAHVLLLSHVLELLVLGRPAHVDVGKQLTELGLTRSLVQLHLKWGCEAAAEPLRRALLLGCCSSSHTSAWVMAVPGVRQQLQQECFALEGPFESHGAIWQLLMHKASGSQQQKVASKPAAAAAAAASGGGEVEGAEQQLFCLLRLQSSSSVQQLQRQVVALQLMVDAQTAAGSGQRLWSNPVSAALRRLAAQLKEMEGSASSGTAAAAKGSLSSSDSDSDAEDIVNTPDTATGTAQQQQPADVEQLQSRRSGQLQPAALRLVKELLTQGGGKTD